MKSECKLRQPNIAIWVFFSCFDHFDHKFRIYTIKTLVQNSVYYVLLHHTLLWKSVYLIVARIKSRRERLLTKYGKHLNCFVNIDAKKDFKEKKVTKLWDPFIKRCLYIFVNVTILPPVQLLFCDLIIRNEVYLKLIFQNFTYITIKIAQLFKNFQWIYNL